MIPSSKAERAHFATAYVASFCVPAMPSLPADDNGTMRLGPLTQLPEGAELWIEGPGFNDQTLKVRCGGSSYFVFMDDLDRTERRLAAHA